MSLLPFASFARSLAAGQGADYYRAEAYGAGALPLPYVGLYLVRDAPAVPAAMVPDMVNTGMLLMASLCLGGAFGRRLRLHARTA